MLKNPYHKKLKKTRDVIMIKIMVETVNCSCCWDNGVTLYSCNRGHLSCKDCLQTGIRISATEKRTFTCVSGNCDGYYSEEILRQVITDKKLLTEYDIQNCIQSIERLHIENLHKCPFCENRIIIDNDLYELNTFYCIDGCKRYSCMRCKKLAHEGPCVNNDQHAKDEQATNNFLIICCNVPFFRGDACNKVRCPKCQTPHCWLCKEKNITYEHFRNQNGCKLYGERINPDEPTRPTTSQLRLPQPVRQNIGLGRGRPIIQPRAGETTRCTGITSRNQRCQRMTKSVIRRCAYHVINN